MSQWRQIDRYFPLRVLLAGWLYAKWLRLHRWARYLLGRSRRQWRIVSVSSAGVRVLE